MIMLSGKWPYISRWLGQKTGHHPPTSRNSNNRQEDNNYDNDSLQAALKDFDSDSLLTSTTSAKAEKKALGRLIKQENNSTMKNNWILSRWKASFEAINAVEALVAMDDTSKPIDSVEPSHSVKASIIHSDTPTPVKSIYSANTKYTIDSAPSVIDSTADPLSMLSSLSFSSAKGIASAIEELIDSVAPKTIESAINTPVTTIASVITPPLVDSDTPIQFKPISDSSDAKANPIIIIDTTTMDTFVESTVSAISYLTTPKTIDSIDSVKPIPSAEPTASCFDGAAIDEYYKESNNEFEKKVQANQKARKEEFKLQWEAGFTDSITRFDASNNLNERTDTTVDNIKSITIDSAPSAIKSEAKIDSTPATALNDR